MRKPHSGKAEGRILRQARALQLRIQGKTYTEIALSLEISQTQAYQDIKEALDEANKLKLEKAEQYMAIIEQKIDYAIQKIISKVDDGDVAAIEGYRKLIRQKAELWGII